MANKKRIFYIDNLRIFLTALVVLHHFAITYGAPGGWFYNESEADFPEVIPLVMFVTTNQAFFMGMFFFISAYFLVPSLEKKGIARIAKERLVRLGIPTLLFFIFLFPLTIFIRNRFIRGEDTSYWELIFEHQVFGFGPMWFVEALLIFTFVYLLWRYIRKEPAKKENITAPGPAKILLAAGLIGVGQFVIRIWMPVGWSMPFTNFQFPHFLQYIFLFAMGTVAYKQNWLESLSPKMGWRWFIFSQILIFIVFPAIFILGGAIENGTEPFVGGWTWQNFAYAVYEQLLGFSLIVALFGIFKHKWNIQGNLAKKLSAGAYGTYVFHAPLLVLISAVFLGFSIPQLWKFVVLAPLALVVCFGVGYVVKQLPGLKSIF